MAREWPDGADVGEQNPALGGVQRGVPGHVLAAHRGLFAIQGVAGLGPSVRRWRSRTPMMEVLTLPSGRLRHGNPTFDCPDLEASCRPGRLDLRAAGSPPVMGDVERDPKRVRREQLG